MSLVARGLWDPPGPGIKPVSPALAGRFFTTEPQGGPCIFNYLITFPGNSDSQLGRHCHKKLFFQPVAKYSTNIQTTGFFVCFFCFVWLRCTACGILVPRTRMEPKAWAVKVQSPDHWTTREFPTVFILSSLKIIISQTRKAFLKLTSLSSVLGVCCWLPGQSDFQ